MGSLVYLKGFVLFFLVSNETECQWCRSYRKDGCISQKLLYLHIHLCQQPPNSFLYQAVNMFFLIQGWSFCVDDTK